VRLQRSGCEDLACDVGDWRPAEIDIDLEIVFVIQVTQREVDVAGLIS